MKRSRTGSMTAMFTVLFAAFLTLLSGCMDPGRHSDVLVFAAASTMGPVERLAREFEEREGIPVIVSFAGSSTLAKQIASGANADIFLSAHMDWTRFLMELGRVNNMIRFLTNELVVIAPIGMEVEGTALDFLRSPDTKHVAMGDPETVPAGMYGKDALRYSRVWHDVEPKIVAAADVRQALAYVEQGEAEAGIVYATDAAISDKIQVVGKLDSWLSEPIEYSLVLLKEGVDDERARKFFDFLLSPQGRAAFEDSGFKVIAARQRVQAD